MGAILLLKVSLLLSVTLLAARLLRRAPAVTRHGLWTLVFAAVLALPLLAAALPALYVPVPAGWETAAPVGVMSRDADGAGTPEIDPTGDRRVAKTDGDGMLASSDPRPRTQADHARSAAFAAVWSNSSALLSAAWLAGTTAATAVLILSLLRVRRLGRSAEDVGDPAWRDAAATIGARLGLRRPPRLLLSPDIGTPMAGGAWRPTIFLPASARAWSAERRDIVLAHEIAHLARRDTLRHMMTRLALACYWFHPLAWIAARQSAVAREQACDEAVLALGTRPSAYARVLLELAESLHPSPPMLGALPMVEGSLLEKRLMAILNVDMRPTTRRAALIPAIGVALLTLSVAAAQPAVSPSAPNIPAAAEPSAAASIIPVSESPSVPATVPVPGVSRTSVPANMPQADLGRDSACWWDVTDSSFFSGSISTSDAGGRLMIREQVGTRGSDRVIQKNFGDSAALPAG